MTYNVTAENGISKINERVKTRILGLITPVLAAEYGESCVQMARTDKNILALKVGKLTEKGFEYDYCFTIDVTAKSYKEKKTKNGIIDPFDFEMSVDEYNNWIDEKEKKEAEKQSKKASGGTAATKKAQKKAELEKRSAELDAIADKVAEKRKTESAAALAKAKEITEQENN